MALSTDECPSSLADSPIAITTAQAPLVQVLWVQAPGAHANQLRRGSLIRDTCARFVVSCGILVLIAPAFFDPALLSLSRNKKACRDKEGILYIKLTFNC